MVGPMKLETPIRLTPPQEALVDLMAMAQIIVVDMYLLTTQKSRNSEGLTPALAMPLMGLVKL